MYTHNGMHQGVSYGSAGLVAFQGDDFTWAWPVEGDLRDESSHAYASYNAYWEDHLASWPPAGWMCLPEPTTLSLTGTVPVGGGPQ